MTARHGTVDPAELAFQLQAAQDKVKRLTKQLEALKATCTGYQRAAHAANQRAREAERRAQEAAPASGDEIPLMWDAIRRMAERGKRREAMHRRVDAASRCAVSERDVRQLIALAYPDRWDNHPAATQLTQALLELRARQQGTP